MTVMCSTNQRKQTLLKMPLLQLATELREETLALLDLLVVLNFLRERQY
jgi:hypothetical protein